MVFKRVTIRKDNGMFYIYLGCRMSPFAWYSPDLCLCSSIIIIFFVRLTVMVYYSEKVWSKISTGRRDMVQRPERAGARFQGSSPSGCA